MRSLVAMALAALASAATAAAQPASFAGLEPAPSAFGPDPVIHITTTFRARIEGVTDAREVPSPTAQDSARRSLYNMAANECRVLAEYWKAECRLNSFTVYVPLASPDGGERDVPSLFGRALYELKLQSQGQ